MILHKPVSPTTEPLAQSLFGRAERQPNLRIRENISKEFLFNQYLKLNNVDKKKKVVQRSNLTGLSDHKILNGQIMVASHTSGTHAYVCVCVVCIGFWLIPLFFCFSPSHTSLSLLSQRFSYTLNKPVHCFCVSRLAHL